MLSSAKNSLLFDRQFWGNRKNWPHDPPGYVFLAHAFHEVGVTSYRGEWVQPPRVNEPAEPEEPANGSDDEEIWDKYEQEDDRYEDRCEKARVDCENMWANVARMIAEACETSALASAVRAKAGGEMNELEPHYWSTENFAARFFRCDISLTNPFARSRFDRSHWIYVTRDSLDRYSGKLPPIDVVAEPERSEGSHQASPGVIPEKGIVATSIQRTEFGRSSKRFTLIRSMTTLICLRPGTS